MDIGAFQELQNNWTDVDIEYGLYYLLKTEVTTRTITGHNTHKEYVGLQYGGKSMASFYLVASQVADIRRYNY